MGFITVLDLATSRRCCVVSQRVCRNMSPMAEDGGSAVGSYEEQWRSICDGAEITCHVGSVEVVEI